MTIPADPAVIPIVTDGVIALLEEQHWPVEDATSVQLALQEAVANAIRHGCRGDVSKHVHCSVSCDEAGEVIIVVRDPGPGFDPSAIADPLDATNVLKPSGRGIFLMQVSIAAEQRGEGDRQRYAYEFIGRCVVSRCPRAPQECIARCTRQIECRGERAHGFDMRSPSFPALEGTDAMN